MLHLLPILLTVLLGSYTKNIQLQHIKRQHFSMSNFVAETRFTDRNTNKQTEWGKFIENIITSDNSWDLEFCILINKWLSVN